MRVTCKSRNTVLRLPILMGRKQPSRGVLMKRCSQNVQLCNFIEIALWHGCFLVNPLHIFITPFPKNTSWLLLLGVIPLGIVMCTTRQNFQKWCFPVWLSLFSNFLTYRLSSWSRKSTSGKTFVRFT